ncbi:MAG: cysteine hydrolase [Peptoniphilaceae bacterium]|nr:cysteine hydrolase [Peptoniphilaceae bacterium]
MENLNKSNEEKLNINLKESALVLIDLQKGVTSVDLKPHSSEEIINNVNKLIEKFKKENGFIAFVKSSFVDDKDALPADIKLRSISKVKGEEFDKFDDRLNIKENDYKIIKRSFSAFFGTDLDFELRRHKIKNVIFAGVSTHVGIDTAARDAYQFNYKVYFLEDAISAPKKKLHDFEIKEILPLFGDVIKTEDIL